MKKMILFALLCSSTVFADPSNLSPNAKLILAEYPGLTQQNVVVDISSQGDESSTGLVCVSINGAKKAYGFDRDGGGQLLSMSLIQNKKNLTQLPEACR